MKKQIFLPLLITVSFVINGCALVSPFKPINSCKNTKNNGANCATIESNLEYSINKDNTDTVSAIIPDNATINPADAEKDEIARLIKELNIEGGSSVDSRPILISASSYRVLVMPYSNGDKFYSARYVYITAGLPKWVSGNRAVTSNGSFNIDMPEIKTKPLTDADKISSIDMSKKTPKIEVIEKYTVTAYLLNCRETPSDEGQVIAVMESGTVIETTDRVGDWFKTNYYGAGCYIHSSYLSKGTH